MAGPFRISKAHARAASATGAGTSEFQGYLDRLMRMIPAEVVGLYLVGAGMIDVKAALSLAVWTVICVIAVISVRAWGSRDPLASLKPGPDWTLVMISTGAFIIWIYNIGGVFTAYGVPNRPWSALLVLVWTFFIPIFYKGI